MADTQEKSSKPAEKTWINIRIVPALRERLERVAEKNERSLGREASVAIREYVEREEVA